MKNENSHLHRDMEDSITALGFKLKEVTDLEEEVARLKKAIDGLVKERGSLQ